MANFMAFWLDGIFELEERLLNLCWHPSPPTCFIAHAPKAREIHAPAFADRVVHQLLVFVLEKLYEPHFIFDSYSNRKGKGTHAAVRRLQRFVRQVHSGEGGGYYLQLDIKNFFNSIHRPTLYQFLKVRMERAGLPLPLQRAVHALLTWPIARTGVRWACTAAEREAVPPHKRLENAPAGHGIAIGNLSSQFFANVYLDRLDQFIKHALPARGIRVRYLRYVDDFVLVHRDDALLQECRGLIEAFLRDELKLELKADQRLRPLTAGVDFLGYIVYPTHLVVRRRVAGHCRAKLAAWGRRWVRGARISARADIDGLRARWASYQGHFRHARSYRLQQRIHQRFPWLAEALAEKEIA
jgi:hypothetical protein